jgi:choline dehydrogenase
MSYDVVVAGGGAAGCVLAARLSENPARSVCLLEGGEVVEGRLVVLACGAYGTPALLLRSGLGDGSRVGEGLADHPGVGLGFAEDPAGAETQMSQVTIRVRSTLARDEDWDAFFFSAEEGPNRSIVVFSMTPVSRGRVRLEDGALVVEHGFLADDDAGRIVEVIRTVRELLGPDERPGPDADLLAYVYENVRGFFHPVGTCALGRVVDAGGRMLGVDRVAIGDASVIPNVPRVPTHLTVLAVAERLAEALGE